MTISHIPLKQLDLTQPQLHSMQSAFSGDRPRTNRAVGSVLCRTAATHHAYAQSFEPMDGDNAQAVSLKLTTRILVIGHEPCSCQGLLGFSHARHTLLGSLWHTACSDERFGIGRQVTCSLCITISCLRLLSIWPEYQLGDDALPPALHQQNFFASIFGLGFHGATVFPTVFSEYSSPCVDVSEWLAGGTVQKIENKTVKEKGKR